MGWRHADRPGTGDDSPGEHDFLIPLLYSQMLKRAGDGYILIDYSILHVH